MSAYRILAVKAAVQILCLIRTSIGKIFSIILPGTVSVILPVALSMMLPVALTMVLSVKVSIMLTYYYMTQFEDFYEANYRKYLKSIPQQQEPTVTQQSYIMRRFQARNFGND